MYLVFDFLKNGLSGVVSYNHLYFSPPLSKFKGGSFEPFEPPLLRACDLYGDAMLVLTWMSSNMADGNQQKDLLPSFATKA